MVTCFEGQHYTKFRDGRAIIPVWELFNIQKCWEKNIKNLCGIVCESSSMCIQHRKLHIFKHFTEEIKNRNINNDIVVTEILIKDNCQHPYCMGGGVLQFQEQNGLEKTQGCEKEQQNIYKFLF